MNTDQKKSVKRSGRKRRLLGWTLLALGLLVAGVWVWSGFFGANWFSSRFRAFLDCGVVTVVVMENETTGWVHWKRDEPFRGLEWRVYAQFSTGESGTSILKVVGYEVSESQFFFEFVLWPIPLLLWTAAAVLLRSGYLARRRAMKGTCIKCGYDLAGLALDAPCPECGRQKTSHG